MHMLQVKIKFRFFLTYSRLVSNSLCLLALNHINQGLKKFNLNLILTCNIYVVVQNLSLVLIFKFNPLYMLIILHALYAKTQKKVKREQDNNVHLYVKINNI